MMRVILCRPTFGRTTIGLRKSHSLYYSRQILTHDASWNDLQGADLHPVADYVAQFVVDKNADISCADLITDTDGPIDVGVLTVHNDDAELGLTQSEWDSAMAICKKGEN